MAVQQITEYIRQHRDAYAREVIDRQLLDAGYRQDDIAAAWDALGGVEQQSNEPLPPLPVPYQVALASSSRWGDEHAAFEYKPKRVVSSPLFWAVLVGFVVLAYGLPIVMLIVAPRNQYGTPNLQTASIGLYASLFMLLIAIIGGIISLRRNRPFAMGLLIGVLVALVVLPLCGLLAGMAFFMFGLGGFFFRG